MKSALIDRRDFLFLALISVLPLLGYQFGLGNQVEQFAIVRRFLDPDFIPADFYVNSASGFGPRYYYALFLSVLTRVAPFPIVILFLTVLTNFALAVTTFDAARRHLRASVQGAAISALIVIVNSSFSLGLAGFIRFESFQPANIAIPLALIGLSSIISERLVFGAGAFAASAIFHPLIGVEAAMIAYAASASASLLSGRSIWSLLRFVPSGLLFCAVIFAFWVSPAMGDAAEHLSDAEFFSILPVFRAPHHYLAASFPAVHYITAGVFAACLGYLVLRRRWHEGANVDETTLALAVVLIIVLCGASYVLVDLAHNRAFTAAQVFRNLLFLKWIGYLFFGWAAGVWLGRPSPLAIVAAIAPVLATGEAQPIVLAAAIGALTASGLLNGNNLNRAILAVLLAAFTAAIAYKYGVKEEIARALFGVGIFWLLYDGHLAPRLARAAAAASVAAAIAFGYWNKEARLADVDVFLPKYSWTDIDDDDAVIARWAKDNTPADSLWAVPPDFERFRLLAERAVIADYTSIPFNEMAMREWRSRMRTLYGDVDGGGFKALRAMDKNYRELSPQILVQRASQFGAEYAVIYARTPWPDDALYQYGDYKIVHVTAAAD